MGYMRALNLKILNGKVSSTWYDGMVMNLKILINNYYHLHDMTVMNCLI